MEHSSEAEAQRIFADAARATAATPPEGGLSLDELREIGRAAGLDPDAVTAAATALRSGAPPDVPMWGATPLATRRTRTVAGQLSDDAWADAVSGLQREFKAQGITETIGRTRMWTYAAGSGSEMVMARLTAEPVGESTRLTLESGDRGEKRAAAIVTAITLGMGAFFAPVAILNGKVGAGVAVAFVCAALAALIYGLLRSGAMWQARVRPARFDAVLDGVVRLVSAGAEAAVPAASVEPLLDLPDDETTDDSAVSPTRRTRA